MVNELLSNDDSYIDCPVSLNKYNSSSINCEATAIRDSEFDSDSSLSSFVLQDKDVILELNISFSSVLASWATRNRYSRGCINELLLILKGNGLNDLPLGAGTLLQTSRSVNCYSKCEGSYVYLGIECDIKEKLQKHPHDSNKIELLVNIDCLPLFKPTGTSL